MVRRISTTWAWLRRGNEYDLLNHHVLYASYVLFSLAAFGAVMSGLAPGEKPNIANAAWVGVLGGLGSSVMLAVACKGGSEAWKLMRQLRKTRSL